MKEHEFGVFCEVFGKTLKNKVIETILEYGELDFAVSDILEMTEISKPKLYQIIQELKETEILIESRNISGTQLYSMNNNNIKTILLKNAFDECIKKIIQKNKNKKKISTRQP